MPWLWWWWHQEGVGGGGQVREIIVYLLVAAGIDPVTHVRVQHDAEVEDHQPDENDNNRVEIVEQCRRDHWLMKTTVTKKTIFTIKLIWQNSVYVKSLI